MSLSARLRPARSSGRPHGSFVRSTASGLGLVLALALVFTFTFTFTFAVGPAAAESPADVAEEVADDGVFVGFGRPGVDEDALVAAVEDARFDGLRLVVIVPRDPQPTPAAFARRVQEQTDADAALVFPLEGPLETYVIEDLSASRIRATETAREFTDHAQAVQAFVTEVNSKREAGTPEIVGQILNALVLMTVIVGVVVVLEQVISRLRKPAKAAK